MKTERLLLVDDEVDFRNIMAKFFNQRRIEYETAGNCTEALDHLAKNGFDVVVMDVSMPGRDGLECMAEMKKVWPEVEIIILTGHANLSLGLFGMKSGAFDYCLKPVDFNELLEKIVLARRSAAGKTK